MFVKFFITKIQKLGTHTMHTFYLSPGESLSCELKLLFLTKYFCSYILNTALVPSIIVHS